MTHDFKKIWKTYRYSIFELDRVSIFMSRHLVAKLKGSSHGNHSIVIWTEVWTEFPTAGSLGGTMLGVGAILNKKNVYHR